jgi:hypothetical protein
MDSGALEFWTENKEMILMCAKNHQKYNELILGDDMNLINQDLSKPWRIKALPTDAYVQGGKTAIKVIFALVLAALAVSLVKS